MSKTKKMARSAGGHCLQLSQTNPINFAIGPTDIIIQLWTGEDIQEALLGMDVLLCMDASLDFKDGEALRRHLTLPEAPKMTSAVITYLNDILIASETEEEHDKDLRAMIDYLHVKGHKMSYD
ncbi:unnamed protein product [Gadus morhua 'NCC']